jgi:hypothetical protein
MKVIRDDRVASVLSFDSVKVCTAFFNEQAQRLIKGHIKMWNHQVGEWRVAITYPFVYVVPQKSVR